MANVFVRWIEMYTWRIVFSVLLIAFSLILVFEPHFWVFDALDAMRIPYAIGLTAFTMFFFIRNNKILSSSAAIALLILAPGLWKYFKPEQRLQTVQQKSSLVIDSTADISVLHFNVKENNKNILPLAESALQSGADILSFQEVHDKTLEVIDNTLHEKYPYHISDISIKGYGMAVYSKYPLEERNVLVKKDFPVLSGVIKIHNNVIHFISATTSTPTNEKGFTEQRKQFKVMADYISKIDSPMVVMGDMNSVPWSEQIVNFLQETQLKDSRKDLSATFPANSIFQIPIDYIFHSNDLKCTSFGTLQQSTSNHLGIMGYYKLIPKEMKNTKNTDK